MKKTIRVIAIAIVAVMLMCCCTFAKTASWYYEGYQANAWLNVSSTRSNYGLSYNGDTGSLNIGFSASLIYADNSVGCANDSVDGTVPSISGSSTYSTCIWVDAEADYTVASDYEHYLGVTYVG